MRSFKSGLIVLAATGAFGVLAVVGCSASGSSGVTEDQAPTEPTGDDDSNTLQPSQTSSGDPAKKDAGKDSGSTKDSGKPDAAKDAGTPPPVPGDACATPNEIKSKSCGKCGLAETACIAGVWTDYGVCTGETGECEPGTTSSVACGNCGTQAKTCNQYCSFTVSACAGEPANSCVPGSTLYTSAGCGANTYRSQVCTAACTQGNLSATCAEPNNPNKMVASATVGQIVAANWTLDAAHKMAYPEDCPGGSLNFTETPFVAVEVANPNATQPITISAFHKGTPELDTVIWGYAKTLPPTPGDAVSTGACQWGLEDSCNVTPVTSPTACGGASSYNWAGMSGVTIPAGGKVLIYSAGYSSSVVGTVGLNIRTDKVGP